MQISTELCSLHIIANVCDSGKNTTFRKSRGYYVKSGENKLRVSTYISQVSLNEVNKGP